MLRLKKENITRNVKTESYYEQIKVLKKGEMNTFLLLILPA